MKILTFVMLAVCWIAVHALQFPASALDTDQPVVIGSLAELPPRSYSITKLPSELLDDAQAFAELALQFERDLLDDLERYRFDDRSATRRYYQTLARLAMIDGRFDLALERIEQARAYEDKPAGRLTLGLAQIAAIAAMQAETDQAEAVFRARFDQLLSGLPLEEAEPELRAMRSGAAFLTDSFLRGWVEAQVDLAAQDLTLSMLQVNRLVSARADLELAPYSGLIGELINHHLGGWSDDVVDIWAERQIDLPDAEHLTPVVVAIWDSGMDTDLFSGQLFVDPTSPPDHPVHGLAFDIEHQPTRAMLFALEDMPDELPECPYQAMADLRAGLESPAAQALRQLLAGIEPARVRAMMNALSDCQSHYHGTHVAGIAAEGNPAIRLLNLRTTFDTRTPPAPPTEQRRAAMLDSWRQMTEYMNAHGVRVANMSWGFGPAGIERILEMTGMGDSAEERRAMAREIYDNGKQELTALMASAPEVLYIAAAMNADSDNRFMEQIPASIELPNLLTVGAVDRAGREAPFTSYGKVDLYASGVEVESYVPGGMRVPISGTSMAAPQVANLAAKLLALQPDLTTAELRQLILDGADEHEIGEGRSIRLLNPARSVALLKTGNGNAASPARTDDLSVRLHALADEIMHRFLVWNPETVTQLGLPLDLHHVIEDRSPEALLARRGQIAQWRERLALIDPEALEDSKDRVLLGLLRHQIDSAAEQKVCRQEYWNLSQNHGWHLQYPRLAEIQPVATTAEREAALQRYAALPAYIDIEINNLRAGLEQGYAVPRVVLVRVIGQLDRLLAPPAAESPFAILAANARQANGEVDELAAFEQQVESLVAEKINPALEKFRDFLADEYPPRETFGVDALPDGEACYEALLRDSTTLSISPRQLHEMGLREMTGIHKEILELGSRLFDLHTVPEILDHYRTHPELLYSNRDEILQVALAAVDRARDEMPSWFGILPRADVVVEPVPAFMEADVALARYRQPPEDGSRPGAFLINLHAPERQPRGTTEAIAFHEAIPGHHMQIAIQQELKGVHMVARYARTTAFTEGWALYTERLADEMGLYSSDLDRLGMLTTQAFRAARLVVDSGIHALGWDREQAVDYMVANTGQPRHNMEVEVDRYIIRPAQATAYMTGMLEIRRLRELAENRLGERFDIRNFHDRVLENGAVTLPMLAARIEAWIDSLDSETRIHMPAFTELEESWNTMKPGGETSCAHGDEYQFFVFPGDPKKLKIYFNGGGACWNAQTCSPDHEPTPYLQSIGQDQNPAWMARQFGAAPGVLDHTYPDNPFAEYTMVHVPYCTGDVQLGNRDAEYTLYNDDGSEETFTIRHRGQTNVGAVLDWVFHNLEEPEAVFISGGSAGGMAVAYYLSVLADQYPKAQVVALADDIGSYRAEEMNSLDHRKWGVPDVLPDQDRWGSLWDQGFDMSDLITRGGTGLENGRIYMFDHAYDSTQFYYIELLSGQHANVLELITINRRIIREQLPGLRSYTAGGMKHTILFDPLFYKVQTDGVSIRDWVAAIAAGDEVQDILCSNCIRTGFVFKEDDLRIIEHAIELLSVPGQWNAQQDGPRCPQDSETYSLVCAVIDGARSMDALSAVSPIMVWYPAALWEVINASAELLDEYPSMLAPLTYNNRPGATQEEIVQLLETVRARMESSL